jgi:hypothetical protein
MPAARPIIIMNPLRVAALFLALSGCGGNGTTMMPPPNQYEIKTPSVMLAAGEEKYVCYTVTLAEPADKAVIEFASTTSAAVHHFEVFNTLAPEPAGLFDCSQTLIKQSWLPLFGGGANAGGLKLPAGAGFPIAKNAQLLLQLHLLNSTAAAVNTAVTVDLTWAADATTITPAGIYALGSMNINLPANSNGVTITSPSCTLSKQYNVFAVQPHMHQLGTSIVFRHGASAATMQTAYQRVPWVFGAQPIDTFSMALQTGELVNATCTYDNTTANAVSYGESTKNEMCYFVLFYTPFDHLNGCVN